MEQKTTTSLFQRKADTNISKHCGTSSTKTKQLFQPYVIFTEFAKAVFSAFQEINFAEKSTQRRKQLNLKLSNPTIEDYNRSRTPILLPPSSNPPTRFTINYELYNRFCQHQREYGCATPEAILKQLAKTMLNCRTVNA